MSRTNQAWEHPPVPTKNGKTLLSQLGGLTKLHDWVYGFYDRMLEDKSTAPFLKKSQQTQSLEVYLKLLKDRTCEYLECVWGGDPWEGQDMFCAHASLHIRPVVFDRAMELAKAQCKSMKISSDVTEQVMQEMRVMKNPMTDPEGKFTAWITKKQKDLEDAMVAEGAVDLTGMGFTTSPAMIKKMAEKKQKENDRRQRLAEQKKKRQAAEKKAKKEKEANQNRDAHGSASPLASPGVSPSPSPLNSPRTDERRHAGGILGIIAEANATAKAEVKEATTPQGCITVPELPIEEESVMPMPRSLPTPIFRAHFCISKNRISWQSCSDIPTKQASFFKIERRTSQIAINATDEMAGEAP